MGVLQQERRYLLLMISAIINQKKAPVLSNKLIPWRNIYQLAETNQVASLSYFGILGLGSEIDKTSKNLFFDSYQKELKNVPLYQSAEEVMLWQMEKNRIHALLLEGCQLRELYPHKEMRKMDRIRIWVQKGELHRVDEIMRSMDYEICENREDEGVLYYKIPGVYVVFYEKLKFINEKLERYFDSPVRMFSKIKGYRYLRCFDKEEAFIYMVGRAANEYTLGRTGVRSVLDFWLYEMQHKEELNWPYIDKTLKKYKLLEFSEHFFELGNIWFGNQISDRIEIYNAMEDYIFSKGKQGRQISAQILPLLQDLADFYKRDRKREWLDKQREWLFPKREYMETLFPVLKKVPWLIPICWLIRWWRVGFSMGKQLCKKKFSQIKSRISETWKQRKNNGRHIRMG